MKIVIRGTNWIGDSVMSIPALRRVRSSFPDASITLATPAWTLDLFADSDFVDEILPLEDPSGPFAGLTAQAGTWRLQKFDLAILLTNSFRSALIAKLAKVKKIFGYRNEGRGILLTKAFEKPVWKNERHEVFYYLNLVSEIEKVTYGRASDPDSEPVIGLSVDPGRRSAARKMLESEGLDLNRRTVVLGPGSKNSRAKRWPAEKFAALSDSLQGEFAANVIIVGTAEEKKVSQMVASIAEHKIVDLTGKTGLGEAVALLAEADLMISNDMGLAHVASAVGTPTITIFGPTNPVTTAPLGSVIVREDVDCSPCMLRDCPIDHRCMIRISPLRVISRAAEMLGQLPYESKEESNFS